jgi:hypothetical protein
MTVSVLIASFETMSRPFVISPEIEPTRAGACVDTVAKTRQSVRKQRHGS